MAKQLTAPGCKYSIVARVDTTIYSPDQKWILDVPAGQHDFIAETNEIIIPGDAMMCRKKCQIDADLVRFNVLGRGAGSLATFVTRAIEQIVGKGNAKVEYGDGKMAVALASSVTAAQVAEVESLLERLLPKDVEEDISDMPMGYTRVDYLEGTGYQRVANVPIDGDENDRLEVVFANYEQVQKTHNLYRLNYVVTPAMTEMELKSCNFSDEVHYGVLGPACRPTMDFRYENSSFFRASDGSWQVTLNCQAGQKYELVVEAKKVYLDGVLRGQLDKKNEYPHVEFVSMTLMNNMVARFYSARFINKSTGRCQVSMIPCLDSTGTPCMFNLVNRQPFYNQGAGSDFIVGLTMAQALDLANLPVPTTNNTLTVSLPKEASLVQHNQEVEAALSTAAEKGWRIAVQYRDEFENEAILNKYAECETIGEVKAVNPAYATDLTSDGEWLYSLKSLTAAGTDSTGYIFRQNYKMKHFNAELDSLTLGVLLFRQCGNLETVNTDLSKVTNVYYGCAGDKNLRHFGSGLPALDPWSISAAAAAFSDCQLDKESVLIILNSLPRYVNTNGPAPITIGIHVDHKDDVEIAEAVARVESINRAVTVQWNGTPTAQPAGTFAIGTLIYAKAGELEHPDGTTERVLDWGHYVTNWEERGYEQFRSLKSAYEYFGLEQEVEK